MNLHPGAPQQLNPQILSATQQVIQVARDIESLLPQARREEPATVDERRIQDQQGSILRSLDGPLLPRDYPVHPQRLAGSDHALDARPADGLITADYTSDGPPFAVGLPPFSTQARPLHI
jgi:hypothetical protein